MSKPGDAPTIAYVLKKYPRLSETFILNEILGLEQAGCAVSIFSLRPADEGWFHRDLSRVRAPVHYPPPFKAATVWEGFLSLSQAGPRMREGLEAAVEFLQSFPESKRASMLLQALQIARQIRSLGVDHVHAHFMTVAASTAYIVHLFTGVPFTVTAHAKDIYGVDVDPLVFQTIGRAARRIITVSDDNRRHILRELLPKDEDRVLRVYNGLPLEDYPALPESPEPDLIVGVGRLVAKKGFDRLLEACNHLRRAGRLVRCVIIGEGEEWSRLHARRRELDLEAHVEFLGPRPHEDVLAWIDRAWVLAAPCIRADDGDQDALPTVILEAIARGLPVVTTRVGGIPEIVEDGREGLLVSDDIEALARALERVLADRVLREAMSRHAVQKAASCFDRRSTRPQLLEAFGVPPGALS